MVEVATRCQRRHRVRQGQREPRCPRLRRGRGQGRERARHAPRLGARARQPAGDSREHHRARRRPHALQDCGEGPQQREPGARRGRARGGRLHRRAAVGASDRHALRMGVRAGRGNSRSRRERAGVHRLRPRAPRESGRDGRRERRRQEQRRVQVRLLAAVELHGRRPAAREVPRVQLREVQAAAASCGGGQGRRQRADEAGGPLAGGQGAGRGEVEEAGRARDLRRAAPRVRGLHGGRRPSRLHRRALALGLRSGRPRHIRRRAACRHEHAARRPSPHRDRCTAAAAGGPAVRGVRKRRPRHGHIRLLRRQARPAHPERHPARLEPGGRVPGAGRAAGPHRLQRRRHAPAAA